MWCNVDNSTVELEQETITKYRTGIYRVEDTTQEVEGNQDIWDVQQITDRSSLKCSSLGEE